MKSKACMSVAQLAKKYSKSEVCTCDQRVNCVCRLEARRPVIGQRKSSKYSHWTKKPSVHTNFSSPSNLKIRKSTIISVTEPGNSTPVKRKLWQESRIKELISTYDDFASIEGESPAKRARYKDRGHEPNSQEI